MKSLDTEDNPNLPAKGPDLSNTRDPDEPDRRGGEDQDKWGAGCHSKETDVTTIPVAVTGGGSSYKMGVIDSAANISVPGTDRCHEGEGDNRWSGRDFPSTFNQAGNPDEPRR